MNKTIYFADKDMNYIGASDCGKSPDGGVHRTDEKPCHNKQVLDIDSGSWVEKLNAPISGGVCQGTTKAGKPCRSTILIDGSFCRSHKK